VPRGSRSFSRSGTTTVCSPPLVSVREEEWGRKKSDFLLAGVSEGKKKKKVTEFGRIFGFTHSYSWVPRREKELNTRRKKRGRLIPAKRMHRDSFRPGEKCRGKKRSGKKAKRAPALLLLPFHVGELSTRVRRISVSPPIKVPEGKKKKKWEGRGSVPVNSFLSR